MLNFLRRNKEQENVRRDFTVENEEDVKEIEEENEDIEKVEANAQIISNETFQSLKSIEKFIVKI
jgi:hypothetical protein